MNEANVKIVENENCCNDPDNCIYDEFWEFAESTATSFVEVWNARYGGAFIDQNTGDSIFIKQVIYQKPEVVILWADGTKSTAHCSKEDTYNLEMGLLVAVGERVFGKTETDALLKDWTPATYTEHVDADRVKYVVDIKDVRKRYRAAEKQQERATKNKVIASAKMYLESCGYKVEKK